MAGNILSEATVPSGNIFGEAMRHMLPEISRIMNLLDY
jgi:hypothetical protein